MIRRDAGTKAEKLKPPRRAGGGTAEGTGLERHAVTAPIKHADEEATLLMEQVVRRENMLAAYKRVVRNSGASGVDGMSVGDLWEHCQKHWAKVRQELLSGTYCPQPVRQVEIPKPGGRGVRVLGIPTVLDRMIQQALLQTLTPIFDPMFSEASFGFRPGRSTHDAVKAAHAHIAAGHRWVVDMDLEKFFDRVNHDVLMARVARQVKDKAVLRLIRRFLQAGVMTGGVVSPRAEGTPQGGPLSPLLSNILLDDLDQELERNFDNFLETVRNVENANNLDLATLRPVLRAGRGNSLGWICCELSRVLRGWVAYYRLSEVKASFEVLDQWIRRKLRCILWRQWRRPRVRYRELCRRGLDPDRARCSAWNGRGPWWNAGGSHMNHAIPTRTLSAMGLLSLLDEHRRLKGLA